MLDFLKKKIFWVFSPFFSAYGKDYFIVSLVSQSGQKNDEYVFKGCLYTVGKERK